MATPKIGALAPAFTLRDDQDQEVSLQDFKGKSAVVLYFYPRAMTPGCTVQACGIRDSKAAFAKAGAVVLGVSPDQPASLAKFRAKEKLDFPLLSDPDHKVAEAYGAWGEKSNYGKKYMGILRSTFLIGKDGKLAHVIGKVNTKTHADDVLQWLKEHPGA
jgi:peroxiredoxin Q/BCP